MWGLLVQFSLHDSSWNSLYDEILELPDVVNVKLLHEEAVGEQLALLGEADHSQQPQLSPHERGDVWDWVATGGEVFVGTESEHVEDGEICGVGSVGQILGLHKILLNSPGTSPQPTTALPECLPCPATPRTQRRPGPPAPAWSAPRQRLPWRSWQGGRTVPEDWRRCSDLPWLVLQCTALLWLKLVSSRLPLILTYNDNTYKVILWIQIKVSAKYWSERVVYNCILYPVKYRNYCKTIIQWIFIEIEAVCSLFCWWCRGVWWC